MSSHVEWTGAADAFVDIAYPGDEHGDGIVGDDQTVGSTVDLTHFALVVGDPGAYTVIEGTLDELQAFVKRCKRAVKEAKRSGPWEPPEAQEQAVAYDILGNQGRPVGVDGRVWRSTELMAEAVTDC